jgi:ubiquinone/menaquinone biosynthesis C-methylase UbiE
MNTYTDDQIAELYDVLGGWAASDEFYLGLAMGAGSVLDVGCGTGMLLHRAREAGHAGRLVGVDPDPSMLRVARRYPGIEWVEGTAAAMTFAGEFELAIMMGHAFQALLTDDDIRTSLAAIRRALAPGGRFVFETRNPGARAWERWTPENATDVKASWGERVRVTHHVLSVTGDVVSMTETTSAVDGGAERIDHGDIRFVDVDTLAGFLAEAGFAIEGQYGNWDRSPFDPSSPEIITVARV